MNDNDGITRFIEAQKGDYEEALAEITAGEKQSHWIWYVFPQLKGMVAAPGIYEKGAIKGAKYLAQAYKLGLKVK